MIPDKRNVLVQVPSARSLILKQSCICGNIFNNKFPCINWPDIIQFQIHVHHQYKCFGFVLFLVSLSGYIYVRTTICNLLFSTLQKKF